MKKNSLAALTCILLVMASVVVTAPAAHADDIRQYQVAFTNGIGVRLRTAPNVNAPGLGADGRLAMPEGAWFPAECEDYGDSVTNIYGESTNIYMRAPGGVWVSTAWLNTGTNARVGLPLCSDKDAALRASVEPKRVSEYHRDGWGVVMVSNPEHTSARAYFSKATTKDAAAALQKANNAAVWSSTLFCASVGLVMGVATGGTATVAQGVGAAALGFGTDVLCSALTGVSSGLDQARGAASAAASAGKCYEVRMHKDQSSSQWVADVWTVTDHGDYCG